MEQETEPKGELSLVEALERNTKAVENMNFQMTSYKQIILRGVVQGLAATIGVTLLTWVLLTVLKPFEFMSPILDKLQAPVKAGRGN